jgi:asparagine synthase (glutamine-hydrolysing)
MAVGREQRVPVLDHNLVELGFCSAPDARIKGTEQRHYMREAAKMIMPEEILRRPKKSIVDPQRKWLKEELRNWVGDLFHSQKFAEIGIFDAGKVREEFAKYCAHDGIPPSGFHIFQYLNVAHWYDRVINGQMYSNAKRETAAATATA